jgi:LysR family pca operon transcriptional activator
MNRYLDQRLKLRHFRIIEAVSQHSSLLRASAALSLAQPALTRSIHEIEEILGFRLYERHAKGVRETQFGEALAHTAKNILQELKQLDETLDRLTRDNSVVVNVGVLPVAAVGVMPGVVARLSERRPELQVMVSQGLSEDLIPDLMAGRLDLIVGRLYDPAAPDGLKREALYHEPISVVAQPTHKIFQSPGPTVERLCKSKLVLPTVASKLGREIDQLLGQMDIDLSAPVRSSSLGFIRELVLSGEFVGIMPRLTLAADLMRGSIKVAPLPIPAPSRPAGIIHKPDRELPPAAVALIDMLRAYTEAIAAEDRSASPLGSGASA